MSTLDDQDEGSGRGGRRFGADAHERSVSGALRVLEIDAARFAAVLETARDGIVSIARDGTVTLFNRSAEEMFGYRADEVLGRNVSMLMPSPYGDEHDGYLARHHRTGEARAIGRIRDVHGRRKNGEVFPIELSVSAARVGADVIYSAILRDVSERARLNAELEEARELARQNERLIDIGAITLKIAHDLGNPVAGLEMQVQRLLRRIEPDPQQPIATMAEPLQQVATTVKRLDNLVGEFKSFAREQRLDLGEVDLPSFLRELVEAWTPEAVERGIDLVLEPLAVAPVMADANKLRRVFDNLLKNSLEAIDRGPGMVKLLTVVDSPVRLRITVEDTGPGIPGGLDVFRLFETTKRNGTGLGLAIAKQIVLAHGGSIGFSPCDHPGTAFHIELPVTGPDLRPRYSGH